MKALVEGLVATWCVDFQCFEICFMHYVWIVNVMSCKFSFFKVYQLQTSDLMICRRRVRQALESATTRPTPTAVGVVGVLTTFRRKDAHLVDIPVLRRGNVSTAYIV